MSHSFQRADADSVLEREELNVDVEDYDRKSECCGWEERRETLWLGLLFTLHFLEVVSVQFDFWFLFLSFI